MSIKKKSKKSSKSSANSDEQIQLLRQELKKIKDLYGMYCRQILATPLFTNQIEKAIQYLIVPEAWILKQDMNSNSNSHHSNSSNNNCNINSNHSLGYNANTNSTSISSIKPNDLEAVVSVFYKRKMIQRLQFWNLELNLSCLQKMNRMFTGPASYNIRMLHLVSCTIDERKAPTIAYWISNSKALEDISLDYNPLGSIGCSIILMGIQSNPMWSTSNSSNRNLSAITPAKKGSPNNETTVFLKLSLKYCQITSEACRDLKQMITSNFRMIHLDLSGNEIANVGMSLLLDSIHGNTYLQYLYLNDNHIGMSSLLNQNNSGQDFKHLWPSLEKNTVLRHLDLQGNHFQDLTVYDEILSLLKSRRASGAKKIGCPLAISCSERGPTSAILKILDLNKSAFTAHAKLSKKKGGKKKSKK